MTSSTVEDRIKVQEWTKTVGAPDSYWIGNSWIPAEGSRLYTTREIGLLFGSQCTLFVGDSLQRRIADTLNLLLKDASENLHYHDVYGSAFTDEYFNSKKHDRGFVERSVPNPESWSSHEYVEESTTGCLNTDWRPLLENVNEFALEYSNKPRYAKHNVIVIGSTVWDVDGSSRIKRNATQIRQNVRRTVSLLSEHVLSHVDLVVWKSSGWCANCPWAGEEGKRGRGDNYRIFAANDEAEKAIKELNDPNFVYLDWGREILPRSIGSLRLASSDGNKYHYGLGARLQLAQMLSETYDHHFPDSLPTRVSGSHSPNLKVSERQNPGTDMSECFYRIRMAINLLFGIGVLLFGWKKLGRMEQRSLRP